MAGSGFVMRQLAGRHWLVENLDQAGRSTVVNDRAAMLAIANHLCGGSEVLTSREERFLESLQVHARRFGVGDDADNRRSAWFAIFAGFGPFPPHAALAELSAMLIASGRVAKAVPLPIQDRPEAVRREDRRKRAALLRGTSGLGNLGGVVPAPRRAARLGSKWAPKVDGEGGAAGG